MNFRPPSTEHCNKNTLNSPYASIYRLRLAEICRWFSRHNRRTSELLCSPFLTSSSVLAGDCYFRYLLLYLSSPSWLYGKGRRNEMPLIEIKGNTTYYKTLTLITFCHRKKKPRIICNVTFFFFFYLINDFNCIMVFPYWNFPFVKI